MALCLRKVVRSLSGCAQCCSPHGSLAARCNCLNGSSSGSNSSNGGISSNGLVDWGALGSEWRNILLAGSPFLMYLFVFKYYAFLREYSGMSEITKPNYHVLPRLEEAIFHCQPHRRLAEYANPFFDFLAAIPYLVHFPLPVFFGVYLYLVPHRRRQLYSFLWCAGWVNFLAVIVQFVFPCAPPWFTDSAVFDESGHLIAVANNEAGFERLDNLFNIKLFHNIYSASPVKFGAMPSLHVAWPAIILVCRPWFNDMVGILHVVWISWAALYSNHHYGVDAMAGIFLVFLVNYCMTRIYCPFPLAAPPPQGSSIAAWGSDKNTLPLTMPSAGIGAGIGAGAIVGVGAGAGAGAGVGARDLANLNTGFALSIPSSGSPSSNSSTQSFVYQTNSASSSSSSTLAGTSTTTTTTTTSSNYGQRTITISGMGSGGDSAINSNSSGGDDGGALGGRRPVSK